MTEFIIIIKSKFLSQRPSWFSKPSWLMIVKRSGQPIRIDQLWLPEINVSPLQDEVNRLFK